MQEESRVRRIRRSETKNALLGSSAPSPSDICELVQCETTSKRSEVRRPRAAGSSVCLKCDAFKLPIPSSGSFAIFSPRVLSVSGESGSRRALLRIRSARFWLQLGNFENFLRLQSSTPHTPVRVGPRLPLRVRTRRSIRTRCQQSATDSGRS